MKELTATGVLLDGEIKTDVAIQLDEQAKITAIIDDPAKFSKDVRRYDGILCPGFVNAHCHLELSWMKSKIPQGEGMASFIKHMLALRPDAEKATIEREARIAIQDLYNTGTVMVADVCNDDTSFELKKDTGFMSYHTFIEVYEMDETKAEDQMLAAKKLLASYTLPEASIVPHAPFSTSTELFKKIYTEAENQDSILSVHLLESEAERQLIEHKSGPLHDLFNTMGLHIRHQEEDVLDIVLPQLPIYSNVLFVHCTELNKEDMETINDFQPNSWFCLCPRSNLYINNSLPDFSLFDFNSSRVCIGTDSLASNTNLSMLEELKVIQQSANTPTALLLKAATSNGAKYLKREKYLGSLAVGTTPGINLITGTSIDWKLTPDSKTRKLL